MLTISKSSKVIIEDYITYVMSYMHVCMYVCMYEFVSVSLESFVSLLRDGDWEVRLFVLVPCYLILYIHTCYDFKMNLYMVVYWNVHIHKYIHKCKHTYIHK